MMQMKAMRLDKRAAIAQTLYCMAVQDKTRPVRFLTPGTKRQLGARLNSYRTFLSWMASEQPLTAGQAQLLIRSMEGCRGSFPPLSPSAREALAAGCAADDRRPPDGEERLLLTEMDMLLTAAAQWLARPGSLRSGPWITGMLAFHNLPRPFWRGSVNGAVLHPGIFPSHNKSGSLPIKADCRCSRNTVRIQRLGPLTVPAAF